jgi:OmpA-OmpF porin, OOP family
VRNCAAVVVFLLLTGSAFADATIPTKDVPGSKDSPLLRRYEGSFIVSYVHQNYGELSLPLSRLEAVPGKTDDQNNQYYQPKMKKSLEGPFTRIVYLLPPDRSPLEILRNYQQEITSKGGNILFECKTDDCGGADNAGSGGGGGIMSLSMYLYPGNLVRDPAFSNSWCAVMSGTTDQRYTAAELPSENAHVSVLTYTVVDNLYCSAFNGRTVAIVEIIEGKPREQNMVTVSAADMAQQIDNSGGVALYGIYFDFDKADVKPESTPTLNEIAKLLRTDLRLKLLVVGHTDNVGGFTSNMALSQRRAEAVVNELVGKYQIARSRLIPVGVSFASPIASNKTEAGRAKNRRVALVEY